MQANTLVEAKPGGFAYCRYWGKDWRLRLLSAHVPYDFVDSVQRCVWARWE